MSEATQAAFHVTVGAVTEGIFCASFEKKKKQKQIIIEKQGNRFENDVTNSQTSSNPCDGQEFAFGRRKCLHQA